MLFVYSLDYLSNVINIAIVSSHIALKRVSNFSKMAGFVPSQSLMSLKLMLTNQSTSSIFSYCVLCTVHVVAAISFFLNFIEQ